MDLEKFKVGESRELVVIDNYDIDVTNFENIKELIKVTFKRLGIDLDGKSIHYQRYDNRTSILALKVLPGDDSDTDNYMFNSCISDIEGLCEVGMNASAKAGQVTLKVANSISSSIVEFFKSVEADLRNKGLADLAFSISMPLSDEKDKRKPFKVKQLLKNILKK